MSKLLVAAPGSDLNTFIKHTAFDLKKRKIEYFIVGYFDEAGRPLGMYETKGRTSWVEFNQTQIIEGARKINAVGICVLHNHPCGIKEPPALTPSDADISSVKNLITSLSDSNLIYLGSWIVSNGHAVEILHSVFFGKNPAISNSSFNEDDANLLLTPALASALIDLTKTALVHRSWYKIIERNLLSTITRGSNRAQFKILRLKYFGHDDDLWLFVIEGTGHDGTEFSAQLTIEQATKAADSIKDLLEVASRLAITSVETDEINLEISDNVRCGFFQEDKKQTGFLSVNNFSMFIKLSDLQCIPDFVVSGLEKIDSLLTPPEENEFSV